MHIDKILHDIAAIEHGFQHILDRANEILSTYSKEQCFELALELFKHEAYQTRMLATTILGRLAATNNDALCFLKEQVSTDKNWRVQEMLAKVFDKVCEHRGYKVSLPLIEEWLNDNNPNVIRAVTEGLRIWTNRPFFKENPSVAIALIAKHKESESEYLRKSIGNALRDISKKHAELIRQEVQQWDLSNPRILFTYKLAAKLLN
ncbi:MAG: DNA alkylation repair protein [Prevotella bivia]|uniref:DNA alkylation repair protein n=1 Tax=Prevotella bivia TaxID=28125 RepID=UPI00254C63C6|nr:DNA alkylation repair protein [Prevotella bivia]MBS6329789.1 DNA alkylation repair protein [Prevotella bivia]MDK7763899.1 DNA alkylation repair protein [Prevotella bivia]MDU2113611.1 DNA alkylation repair protein [Prevotella bivia]